MLRVICSFVPMVICIVFGIFVFNDVSNGFHELLLADLLGFAASGLLAFLGTKYGPGHQKSA